MAGSESSGFFFKHSGAACTSAKRVTGAALIGQQRTFQRSFLARGFRVSGITLAVTVVMTRIRTIVRAQRWTTGLDWQDHVCLQAHDIFGGDLQAAGPNPQP